MRERTARTRLTRPDHIALLEVTPHLYPDVVGGIPLQVDNLSNSLAAYFDTTVATNWLGDGPLPTERKYSLVAFSTRYVPLGNPISLAMTVWLMRNVRRFSVLHTHSHLFLTSILAVFFAKLNGTPVVLSNHGLVSHSHSVWLQHAWISAVSKTFLTMCNKVVCYTDADRDLLTSYGVDKSRIVICASGVDLTTFVPSVRDFRGKLELLWLGRMVAEKGLQNLLSAMAQLQPLADRVHLTLVGAGPLERPLREQARLMGLEGLVSFLPTVSQQNVPSLLAKHDILVLPSLTEGLPRVVLEALATEMPVLCSSLPQLTDALGDCAIYFRPGDPAELAKAIAWAEGNRELLPTLGERGRSLVETRYSWRRTVSTMRDLFIALARNAADESVAGSMTRQALHP